VLCLYTILSNVLTTCLACSMSYAFPATRPLCFYDNTYGWALREKVKAEGAKRICAKYSIDNKVSDRNSQ